MSVDVIWDYSKVSPRKWEWEYDSDNTISVKLSAEGLAYHGEDDYFGGYIVGFQTFEEFERAGPLKNMPAQAVKELRQHLESHRAAGGAFLRFHFASNAGPLKLWRAFVGMNEQTIHARGDRPPEEEKEEVFYEGSCSSGEHKINFALIFQDISKDPVEKWILYGKFDLKLAPNIRHALELETGDLQDAQIEVKTTLNNKPQKLYDVKTRKYSSD